MNPVVTGLLVLAAVMNGANLGRERAERAWKAQAGEFAAREDAVDIAMTGRLHQPPLLRLGGTPWGGGARTERGCEMCLRAAFCCLLGDPAILEERRRKGEERRREVEAVKAVARLYSDLLGQGGGLGDWLAILVGGARIARGGERLADCQATTRRQRGVRKAMRESASFSGVKRVLFGKGSLFGLFEGGGPADGGDEERGKDLPAMEHFIRYSVGVYGWRMLSFIHPHTFHANAGYLLQVPPAPAHKPVETPALCLSRPICLWLLVPQSLAKSSHHTLSRTISPLDSSQPRQSNHPSRPGVSESPRTPLTQSARTTGRFGATSESTPPTCFRSGSSPRLSGPPSPSASTTWHKALSSP